MKPCLLPLVTLLATAQSARLLPIIFMHGVGDNHKEFDGMQGWIRQIDPEVSMVSAPICDDSASFSELWGQTAQLANFIRLTTSANASLYANGYTLLCHSQGALICRTTLSQMDDHRAHTLIALAGPHMGEFGIPQGWQSKIPWGRDLAFGFFLTGPSAPIFQADLSIANFWNDPRPSDGLFGKPAADYCNGNTFLPVLNNNPCRTTQGPGKPKDVTEGARYKTNLLRLQKMVLTCSPVDDMIIPYDSGIFNFYNDDATKTIDLPQTAMWTDDWLGLRVLNETGRLERIIAPNVCHTCWAHDQGVFKTYIAPFLPTAPPT